MSEFFDEMIARYQHKIDVLTAAIPDGMTKTEIATLAVASGVKAVCDFVESPPPEHAMIDTKSWVELTRRLADTLLDMA